MEWIKLDINLKHHPKPRKLARRLGASAPETTGHLVWLWSWAWTFASDGNLTNYDSEDIAEAAGYDGDANKFVKALIEVGFVDDCDGELTIHKWDEHCGSMHKERERRATHMRQARAKKKQSRDGNVTVTQRSHDSNVTVTLQARDGNVTTEQEQEQENINNDSYKKDFDFEEKKDDFNIFCSKIEFSSETERDEKPKKRGRPQKRDGYTDDFERFWEVYPRRVEKQRAFKCWLTKLKHGAKPEDLIAAAGHYAEMCRSHNREAEMIKHASTFLGPNEPWEEYVEGVPKEAMTSYERAIAEGPKLTGIWAKAFGIDEDDEEKGEVIDVEATGLDGVLRDDTWGGRCDEDEWQPPY